MATNESRNTVTLSPEMEECELCGIVCLDPSNESKRQEHMQNCVSNMERVIQNAAGEEKSKDKTCGICWEKVMEKPLGERKFGILINCNHCYCLSCIKTWRRSDCFGPNSTRSCPECRIPSSYIIPSKYWVDKLDEKQQLAVEYTRRLGLDTRVREEENGVRSSQSDTLSGYSTNAEHEQSSLFSLFHLYEPDETTEATTSSRHGCESASRCQYLDHLMDEILKRMKLMVQTYRKISHQREVSHGSGNCILAQLPNNNRTASQQTEDLLKEIIRHLNSVVLKFCNIESLATPRPQNIRRRRRIRRNHERAQSSHPSIPNPIEPELLRFYNMFQETPMRQDVLGLGRLGCFPDRTSETMLDRLRLATQLQPHHIIPFDLSPPYEAESYYSFQPRMEELASRRDWTSWPDDWDSSRGTRLIDLLEEYHDVRNAERGLTEVSGIRDALFSSFRSVQQDVDSVFLGLQSLASSLRHAGTTPRDEGDNTC